MDAASWYKKPTAGNHGQAVIIDEVDGRSVALVYDDARDGALIEAAPDLLAALREVQSLIASWRDGGDTDAALEELKYRVVDAAIRKATGVS